MYCSSNPKMNYMDCLLDYQLILNMDVDFKLLYKMMIIELSKLAQEKWPLSIKNFTISNGFV